MKTEIRVRPHNVFPDQSVVEVWYNGQFIATVTGADGSGVRVISRHPLAPLTAPPDAVGLNVVEVAIQL